MGKKVNNLVWRTEEVGGTRERKRGRWEVRKGVEDLLKQE